MTLDEEEVVLKTINSQKSFLECYKKFITMYFYGIYSTEVGLYVTLRKDITKKVLFDT